MIDEDAKGAPEGRRIVKGGLRLQGRRFRNATKFLVLKGAIDGLTVDKAEVQDVATFLDGASDSSLSNSSITNVTARAMGVGFSRLRGDSHDVVFRDISVEQGAADAGRYPCGFKLDGNARTILYERCTVKGFRTTNTPDDKYWNGDGFSDERGNSAVRYLHCEARGATDGGFDSKSRDSVFDSCVSAGNKRNFRAWNSGVYIDCISESPRDYGGVGGPSHFWFGGDQPRYVLKNPIIRARAGDPTPIFTFQTKQPAIVEIHDADIQAADALLIKVEGGGPAPQIAWKWARKPKGRRAP